MKIILLIVCMIPGLLSAQKLFQRTIKNGTTHIDFLVKEKMSAISDLSWLVIRIDSPYYRFKMVRLASDSLGSSRDDGAVSNVLHTDATGFFKSSPLSRLFLPYSQITGTPTIPKVDSVTYYNASGKINQKIKVWSDSVTISNANGQTVDISSAGFTKIINIQALALKNSTTAPNVAIKGYTLSQVTLNVKEENLATVTLLGINVLSGSPLVFASGSIKAFVQVTGY